MVLILSAPLFVFMASGYRITWCDSMMKKLTPVVFCSGVLIIVVSQWLSNIWLSHVMSPVFKKNMAEYSVSAAHSGNETVQQKSIVEEDSSQPTMNVEMLAHALAPLIEQKIQNAIRQVSVDSISSHMTELSTASSVVDRTQQVPVDTVLSSEAAEDAYHDVLDVVLDAQSRGVWDNSVSMRIAEQADKITIKHQQAIIGEYMKALQEGIVDRNVAPPF